MPDCNIASRLFRDAITPAAGSAVQSIWDIATRSGALPGG